jgi:ABC-2 type transport system permease protein
MHSPLALAWRLQRGTLFAWTIAFAAAGAAFGGVAHSVADLLDTSPRMRLVIASLGAAGDLTDAYFTAAFGILGLVAGGHALQAALRLRSEEEEARAEPVLAASVSRLRWASGHLLFATLGPAIALAAAGAAAGFVHGGVDHIPRLVVAALAQLPAVWVLVALATALFGLAPRYARASWAALAACLLIGQLGRLIRLPTWLLDLSPFLHVPRLPGGPFELAPVLALLVIAAVVAAAGLVGLRRRDIS